MSEKNVITNAQVNELIEHLRGTILSLYQGCLECGIDQGDLTVQQLEKLDEEIYSCSGCGWWYESSSQHEYDDEPYCDDCIDDVKGEDDDE